MTAEIIDLEFDEQSGVVVAKYSNDRGTNPEAIEAETSEWERLPSGRLVKKIKTVRKVESLADRLLRLKTITPQQHEAANRFSWAFETYYGSQMSAVSAFYRMPGGSGTDDHISDKILAARERVNKAVDMLGGTRSLLASCLWFCIGFGETLEQWALRKRQSGVPSMDKRMASGVLVSALTLLGDRDDW